MHAQRASAVVMLALVLGVAVCGPALAGKGQSPGVLLRLAAHLETAAEEVRADFAAVALNEMISAYELEFGKLSVPGQVSRAEIAKQARWSRAVQRFVDDLYAARDDLDSGAAVGIAVSAPDAVQLMIGARLIAVGSPRIDAPQVLEQQIVQVYCDFFECDPELLDTLAPALAAFEEGGRWSFAAGQGSTYETIDGLGFMFSDVRGRSRKERLCLQIGDELERLSRALARARESGRRIDMKALRIEASARSDWQRVVYSAAGDSLRAHLPALVHAPELLEVARPWVVARSHGKRYRQRFPRAERLLTKLLR